jgi:hypothetical protein
MADGETIVDADHVCPLCGERITLQATLANRGVDGLESFFCAVENDKLLVKLECGCETPRIGRFVAGPVYPEDYQPVTGR